MQLLIWPSLPLTFMCIKKSAANYSNVAKASNLSSWQPLPEEPVNQTGIARSAMLALGPSASLHPRFSLTKSMKGQTRHFNSERFLNPAAALQWVRRGNAARHAGLKKDRDFSDSKKHLGSVGSKCFFFVLFCAELLVYVFLIKWLGQL